MTQQELLIGSHVSMKGTKMLVGAVEEAHSYDANTFMIYTGAPQNTRRKSIDKMNIDKGQQLIDKYQMHDFIVHAPYIINLGNTVKTENFPFAVEFLRAEIERAQALGAKQITMHPGAHVGAGADKAIDQIIKGLNEVLTKDQIPQIALETMSGKGTEIGRNFEELAKIIDGVVLNEKLSVTFDTCHVHDAGYDIVNHFDDVLEDFDRIIGLDRLKVLHINDSKNERGAQKDRHANIGMGMIGFEALDYILYHPKLMHLPKILETPYVGRDDARDYAPYYYEIKMIRERSFDPKLIEHIIEDAERKK